MCVAKLYQAPDAAEVVSWKFNIAFLLIKFNESFACLQFVARQNVLGADVACYTWSRVHDDVPRPWTCSCRLGIGVVIIVAMFIL